MPNISITIPEVHQSVARPVIFGIVGQVQEITKINKDAKIIFPGPMGKMQAPGSDVDGISNNRDANFSMDRIVFLEVEEDFDPGSLLTTAVEREEHIPVFEDPKLGVYIAPVYATSKVRINIKYRTSSMTEAERWRDDMRMRISMLRDVNLHKVQYHFGFPERVLETLEDIYAKREAVAPYGQNIEDYVSQHATERLTVIGDLVGKNRTLVVSETQSQIQGLFDWSEQPPPPVKDEASGSWEASFTYMFSYERPIGVNMRYPIMVHNQLLSDTFISSWNGQVDPATTPMSFSKSLNAFHSFNMSSIMESIRPSEPYIRIPVYDDYIIPQVPQGTGTVMLMLFEVAGDKKTFGNLDELGDICIDPDILKFIREVEWPYITQQFKSILTLTLYRNQYQLSSGSILCDKDLNLTAEKEVNLRDQHHVRLGVCVDLTLLPKAAIDRVRQYPKVLMKLLKSMNEVIRYNPDISNLGDKNVLTPLEFSDLYAIMTGYGYNNGQVGRPNTLYNRPINRPSLLDSVDPAVIKKYRDNMITRKTVMVSNIVAMKKD